METLSDFYRGWRVTFNVAVASQPAEEEAETPPAATADGDPPAVDPAKQQSAISLFQSNGGNVSLAGALPLYARSWGDADFDGKNNPNGSAGMAAYTYLRLGGTFDAFGDTGPAPADLDWGELNANAEWAVTTNWNLVTVMDTFQFEAYTNTGVIAGTKMFRAALGIDPKDSGVFLHGEVGASFRLNNGLVVGASYNYYSADGIDGGATLTVGFGR
jgi:hypothetical protein